MFLTHTPGDLELVQESDKSDNIKKERCKLTV